MSKIRQPIGVEREKYKQYLKDVKGIVEPPRSIVQWVTHYRKIQANIRRRESEKSNASNASH